MLIAMAWMRWELRAHYWFWVTISTIAIAESLAVFLIPWTSKWIPAIAILPMAIGDAVVILWLIDTIRRWIEPPQCHT